MSTVPEFSTEVPNYARQALVVLLKLQGQTVALDQVTAEPLVDHEGPQIQVIWHKNIIPIDAHGDRVLAEARFFPAPSGLVGGTLKLVHLHARLAASRLAIGHTKYFSGVDDRQWPVLDQIGSTFIEGCMDSHGH